MANETKHQPNLNEIRDLLSSYLDGEITEQERVWVEQAVAKSPELRAELDSLQQTVNLLAALPVMPAPRPFTLTEADVRTIAPQPKKRRWSFAWVGGLAAAAVALLCVFAAGGLFLSGNFAPMGGAPGAEIAMQREASAPTANEAAQIEAESAVGEESPAEADVAAETPVEAFRAEEPAPAASEAEVVVEEEMVEESAEEGAAAEAELEPADAVQEEVTLEAAPAEPMQRQAGAAESAAVAGEQESAAEALPQEEAALDEAQESMADDTAMMAESADADAAGEGAEENLPLPTPSPPPPAAAPVQEAEPSLVEEKVEESPTGDEAELETTKERPEVELPAQTDELQKQVVEATATLAPTVTPLPQPTATVETKVAAAPTAVAPQSPGGVEPMILGITLLAAFMVALIAGFAIWVILGRRKN